MSEELKPCPFCGGERLDIWWDGIYHYVECWECEAKSVSCEKKAEAITAWNKRA